MSEPRTFSAAETIAGLILSAALGFGVGVLGSLKYRFGLAGYGPTLPIGLVVSLALVAVVLISFRVVLGTRLFAGAAAVGVIAAVVAFSMTGPGGSVVVVGDGWGAAWTVAPAIIAVIVVAGPNLRRRRPRAAGTAADGTLETPETIPSEGSRTT